MRAEAPVDCAKARRELGWQPRPVEESIREAARFWVSLREAKRKSKSAKASVRAGLAWADVTEKLACRSVRRAADHAGDVIRQGA